MEIKAPTKFCKPSVSIIENEGCKDSSYEVYFVYRKDTSELLYVGCGKRGRHKHVFSGSSQNTMLNMLFVFSVDLRICIFGCETKEEALEKERESILRYRPKLNNVTARQASSVKIIGSMNIGDMDKYFNAERAVGLKSVCELYLRDKVTCQVEFPEWFPVVDELGVEFCKSYDYSKKGLKAIYEATQRNLNPSIEDVVNRTFHVGCTYSVSYIKTVLEDAGYQKPKGTTLNKWFITKRVVRKGISCYRIIQRVDDILD